MNHWPSDTITSSKQCEACDGEVEVQYDIEDRTVTWVVKQPETEKDGKRVCWLCGGVKSKNCFGAAGSQVVP